MGYIDVSGRVNHDQVSSIISRVVTFHYSVLENNIFHINNMKTIKNFSDDTDDSISNSFAIINNEKERYIEVSKIGNNFLVSNMHSPVFLCMKND
ncbi:hypothetical protein ACLEUY_17940 [Enterobacter ludwigii]|uniref:hypothetical protein n=1 Tax=Enterobacter ludwigii TaxID=299767 RepID=UPI0039762DA1